MSNLYAALFGAFMLGLLVHLLNVLWQKWPDDPPYALAAFGVFVTLVPLVANILIARNRMLGR